MAREHAIDRRDDVHSPVTGGQGTNGHLFDEEVGGPLHTFGPQAVPTQVSTANGHFEVQRNLPKQRIGAKAWFEGAHRLADIWGKG